MDKWKTLLEESRQLAMSTSLTPPVHRTFQQVAAFAENLRKKVSGTDFNLKELAAARLLARAGVNAKPFVRTAKRSFSEAEQAEDELQRGAKRPFLSRDAQGRSATEQQTIQDLLLRIDKDNREYGPVRIGGRHKQADMAAEHLTHAWSYSGVVIPPSAPGMMEAHGLAGLRGLPIKEQAYVDVVMRMVEEKLDEPRFDAVGEFMEAAAGVVSADEHLVESWGAVKAIVGELGDDFDRRQPGNHATVKSLLRGARKFLESRSDRGMAKWVHECRHVIQIGGDPSKMREIQNYVVLGHQQLGKLDVRDGQEGLNTSWVQIYYALRSGNTQEALQATRTAQWMSPNHAVKPFRIYIEEWVRENGELSAASSRDLMAVCRDFLNSPNPERRSPFFRYKVLTIAFLCGNVDLADELSMSFPKLWENLDEYLWFMVGCTRVGQDAPCFSLSNLHKRIQEYPSTYYSRKGKDPMLYTMVLLVTLQFKEAVAFMAQDSIAEPNRPEAVHFALALHHHGILDAGSSTVSDARAKFSILVESYGHQFSRSNSFLTLDYSLLAVELQYEKPNPLVMAHALRRVLLQTRDPRRLLSEDSGFSQDHPIRKFVTKETDQKNILLHAGNECEKFSENNEAFSIFMAAREYNKALGIVNMQIAQILRKYALDSHQGIAHTDKINAELVSLARKGEAASKWLQPGTIGFPQRKGFKTLETIAMVFRYFFNKRFSEAVSRAEEIYFIPHQASEAREKADCLRFADKSLAYILSDLLQIYVKAVVTKYRENQMNPSPSGQLAGIAAFARLAPPPFVVGKEVFREIVSLENALV